MYGIHAVRIKILIWKSRKDRGAKMLITLSLEDEDWIYV